MISSSLLLGATALALLQNAMAGSFNQSTTCSDSCKSLVLQTLQYETDQHANGTDYSFYETPANYSKTLAPGTILKIERATNLTNYTVPSSLTLSRILYTTLSSNGTVVPTSAFVLWPYAPFEINQHSSSNSSAKPDWPIVAWAHGTSGIFSTCAPSSYRSLQYNFQVPYALALQGYVVVAPDYQGLGVSQLPDGTPVRHPYGFYPAHADDVAYAITAARSAFADLLSPKGPFAVIGHSQGGATTWAFAERQATKPIPGYKGAVAISPPVDFNRQAADAAADHSLAFGPAVLGVVPMIIAGITVAYPEYANRGFNTTGADRYYNIFEPTNGCLATKNNAFAAASPFSFALGNWTEDPIVQEWYNASNPARKPFKGPLLVLNGLADPIAVPTYIEQAVDDTCSAITSYGAAKRDGGSNCSSGGGKPESLEHITYSGVSHFPTVQAAQGKWMGWIRDRLEGKSDGITAGCTKSAVTGFRTDLTISTPFANWLTLEAEATAPWKYAF